MLTAFRSDLPPVGAKIAIRHDSGQWWYGPCEVVDVHLENGTPMGAAWSVEVHPDIWPRNHSMVYSPTAYVADPLHWQFVDQLTPGELEEIAKPFDPRTLFMPSPR